MDERLGVRFWLLAAARTVSVSGNGLGRVALAFGVLSLAGADGSTLSLVLAAQALPTVVLVLFGGVVADRMSRSTFVVACEIGAALSWTALALAVFHGDPPVLLMVALGALAGVFSSAMIPALTGITPQLVSAANLHRANALLRVGQNSALLLGFALAGVLVALVGPAWALVLDALTFAVSGTLVALIRLPSPARAAASVLHDLRTGAREFFSRQWLWVVVAQFSLVVAAISATYGVLGPLVADQHYGGAPGWALIAGAEAAGTVLGALVALRVRPRRPILVAVLATFPMALPAALLAVPAAVLLVALSAAVAGVATDVFGVLWTTTMQREIPPEAISRVSAYDVLGSVALAPLGLLVAGPLADAYGPGVTLTGCAALVVVATAAALLSPQVRSLRA